MATIQGIYIALFGRPADPLGLEYFNNATNNGADLTAIGDLASTAEYQDRFEGMNNAQIVTAIYQSLFGRNPELAGLEFFVNALNNGTLNINNVAIAILDGAQGDDAALVEAKIAAANQFTAAVAADPDAIAAYQGEQGAEFGRAFINQIDDADDELTDEEVAAQIATYVETGAGPGEDPNAPTNPINFTSAVGEQLAGTAGNDSFSGVIGVDAANSTINVGDTVNGAGGVDTLNILVAGGGALPAGFSSSNVEIVNVTATTTDLGALNASSFGGVQQLWQIDNDAAGAGTFQNVTVGADVTAGFRSNGTVAIGAAVDVNAASATQTTISAAIDGVATASTLDFVGAGVKTINVSGNVFNAPAAIETLAINSNATNLDAVNISLTGATVVALTGVATAETINGAGSTGGLTIDLSGSGLNTLSLTALTGGSGNDVFTLDLLDLSAATAAINGGAGNDNINVNLDNLDAGSTATALTITGGAGADTFTFSGADGNLVAVATVANLEASLVSITDFDGTTDVLNIAALGGNLTTQNTVNAAVDGAADLLAAVTAAAGVTANGDFAVFEFGGDTYVYAEIGAADGLDAGDALIQLTGVSLADLTAANFVH